LCLAAYQLKGLDKEWNYIENNEVIYELLSDAGWADKEIDLIPATVR
jgi:hypothetical protein